MDWQFGHSDKRIWFLQVGFTLHRATKHLFAQLTRQFMHKYLEHAWQYIPSHSILNFILPSLLSHTNLLHISQRIEHSGHMSHLHPAHVAIHVAQRIASQHFLLRAFGTRGVQHKQ
jgi:hypothetical protein